MTDLERGGSLSKLIIYFINIKSKSVKILSKYMKFHMGSSTYERGTLWPSLVSRYLSDINWKREKTNNEYQIVEL